MQPSDPRQTVIRARDRWFRAAQISIILTLASLLPTQLIGAGWILVGLFAAASVVCGVQFFHYSLLSGRLYRQTHRNPGRGQGGWPRLKYLMIAYPVPAGIVIFLLGVCLTVLIVLIQRQLE